MANSHKHSDKQGDRLDILHLTSAHPVLDTRIFVKEARALVAAGYKVAVLGPGDTVSRQIVDGVYIHTLSRPSSRFSRFTRFARQLLKMVQRLNPRVVQIHDPDLTLIARLLKRRGIKIVYDVHEEFPKAVLSRTWIGPMVLRRCAAKLVDHLERSTARNFDGFILADTQLAPRFPKDRSVVVRNFLDMSEWLTSPLPERKDIAPLRCVYVGDISEPRGLTRMCDAIQEANAAGHHVVLDLLGRISATHQQTVEAHPSAANIHLYGWSSRVEVAQKLAQADVAFSLLEPTPAYREALPVKVLEYIISGLPVVATDLPRLRQEVCLKDALHFVAWDAPKGHLGKAIIAAAQTPLSVREHQRHIVLEQYSWKNEAASLVNFYRAILGKDK